MDKNSLRKIYKTKRALITDAQIRKLSKKVFENFKKHQIDANNYLVYLPINKEVDTTELIKYLLHNGKNVFVPAYDEKNEQYVAAKFANFNGLIEGPYHIKQPKTLKAINVNEIEVAIIPGIAFTKNGGRLGYGKGIYDRLLKKSKCMKVGYAYDFQIAKTLPREKQDLIMDVILTPASVIPFSPKS